MAKEPILTLRATRSSNKVDRHCPWGICGSRIWQCHKTYPLLERAAELSLDRSLTRRSSNHITSPLCIVMLHCRPQFPSRLLDQNPQLTTDLPDVVGAVVYFYKFNLQFDRWKRGGKVEDHCRLIVGQPSRNDPAELDIPLNIATPYIVGSSFCSSILECILAFGIFYVAIAPADSCVS